MSDAGSYKPKHIINSQSGGIRRLLIVMVLLIISAPISTKPSEIIIDIYIPAFISFDVVPVDFEVNGFLRFETDVIITESERVYIDVEDLFEKLSISCKSDDKGNVLTGFIEESRNKYTIDVGAKHIKRNERIITSRNGMVKESGANYIEATVLSEAFCISIIYNARSLSIKMHANFELPMIKKLRLDKMRNNIKQLQTRERSAEIQLGREYHFLKLGNVDWSIASFQSINQSNNIRLGLGIGSELLYGQANVFGYYDSRYKYNARNLHYDWRWVDNGNDFIRQAQVGKISHNSIAFLNSPVLGAKITNSPNTLRKAKGFYTISEYTEPNWTIELYINDVLVDYTEADASGFFTFKIPVVYGFTTLKLKYYGPLGEERTEERAMNVPFSFLPPNTIEYSISAGILEDDKDHKFIREDVNFGVNRYLTIGGGLEYLSSIETTPFIPYAKIAFQPHSRIILNMEYAHDVRTQGLISYNFGKSSFLEINYARYVKGQQAVKFKSDEELKVRLSLPFRFQNVSGFTKINYKRNVYDNFNYNQVDAVFSGYYKNYNANLSTLVSWINEREPFVTSIFSLSTRLKNGFLIRPSVEYNLSDNNLLRYKIEIEKRVIKSHVSLSFERNVSFKHNTAFLSFRHDLPYGRSGISLYSRGEHMIVSENAQGSLAFGAGEGMVKSSANSTLGKGGILFYPFLDLNQNGVKDSNEKMVYVNNVRVSGGKAEINLADSIIRVSELNAFIYYFVEFSDADLDNFSLRIKHKTYQVLVDPNQFKRVYVPVISMGEISGNVYMKKEDLLEGLGRITVEIYNKSGEKVAQVLSESEGYFYHMGLTPGEYEARPDKSQLSNLGFTTEPESRVFKIEASEHGDIIEGIDFVLSKLND